MCGERAGAELPAQGGGAEGGCVACVFLCGLVWVLVLGGVGVTREVEVSVSVSVAGGGSGSGNGNGNEVGERSAVGLGVVEAAQVEAD